MFDPQAGLCHSQSGDLAQKNVLFVKHEDVKVPVKQEALTEKEVTFMVSKKFFVFRVWAKGSPVCAKLYINPKSKKLQKLLSQNAVHAKAISGLANRQEKSDRCILLSMQVSIAFFWQAITAEALHKRTPKSCHILDLKLGPWKAVQNQSLFSF